MTETTVVQTILIENLQPVRPKGALQCDPLRLTMC